MSPAKGAPVTKLLLDTNVWIDYYLGRSAGCAAATRLLGLVRESETFAVYVASHAVKDIAYILAAAMKDYARERDGALSPEASAAAREVAWGCVRDLVGRAFIIPVGQAEITQAFTFKGIHDDLEDDIVLGAAYRAGVDYIVTHDRQLARRSPVPCIGVERALELVEG